MLTALEDLKKAFILKGYEASVFKSKEDAADYIEKMFCEETIGFGDSLTLEVMELNKRLSVKNTVIDPAVAPDGHFIETAKNALTTKYFFTSANAVTSDGIIVNLDGTGNRVAGSLFGHEKVFFVIGKNKIASTLEDAVCRVRNVAAPLNACRLKLNTPCAIKGDKCYDCSSPDRICNGLLIQYRKMNDIDMEVILIDEDLGL